MIHRTVRYTVEPGSVEKVKLAVAELVAAIKANEPGTVIYEAFLEHDGVSFVHMMIFKDEESAAAHRTAKHTDAFVESLYPNCTSLPVISDLTMVGSTSL